MQQLKVIVAADRAPRVGLRAYLSYARRRISEPHGPYRHLYEPKKGGGCRTSEYVGKALAGEFGVSKDERTAG